MPLVLSRLRDTRACARAFDLSPPRVGAQRLHGLIVQLLRVEPLTLLRVRGASPERVWAASPRSCLCVGVAFAATSVGTKGLLHKSEVRIRTDHVTLWVRGRDGYLVDRTNFYIILLPTLIESKS